MRPSFVHEIVVVSTLNLAQARSAAVCIAYLP
jgi:hypothetical protein